MKQKEDLEKQVLGELSLDEVYNNIKWFSRLAERLTGTEELMKAVQFTKSKLEEYKVPVELLSYDSYVSFPLASGLEIISPTREKIESVAYAFSGSTPQGGVTAELVPVGPGSEEDYKKTNARGKIVLAELSYAPMMNEKVRVAEKFGAVGLVMMNWGTPEHRVISRGVARTVWGNPTPETLEQMPRIPVVAVTLADGDRLKRMSGVGPVNVQMEAEASRMWVAAIQPLAVVKSATSDDYVLVGGHLDSWCSGGVTDNASGCCLMLELARVLCRHHASLRRGIKFVWFTGHENLYGGSTWFADNFRSDLDNHCVAYYKCDSVGVLGTSRYASRNYLELRGFETKVVSDVLGESVDNGTPTRDGDQSFWGVGIPSIDDRTLYPVEEEKKLRGAMIGWWLHTPEDSLDKLDIDALNKVLKVYAVSISRLANSSILPYDFATTIQEIHDILIEIRRSSGDVVRLDGIVENADMLLDCSKSLASCIDSLRTDLLDSGSKQRIDNEMMKLCRVLDPLMYTVAERYEQDTAFASYLYTPTTGRIPRLHPLKELANMDRHSSEFKTLLTKMVREKNRVSDVLQLANEITADLLSYLQTMNQC